MDPTTVIIVTNYISAGIAFLESTLALMPILILLAIFAIVVGIIEIFKGMTKNGTSQPQQVQQQNSNQQADKDHVLVDIRSLQYIKESVGYAIIAIIATIIAFIGLLFVTNIILVGTIFFFIILFLLFAISDLARARSKLKENMPKRIKKIIKKTIIYEDGSTEEHEEKYEC